MAKTPNKTSKHSHFIFKVTQTNHSVSNFMRNDLKDPQQYYESFRTDRLTCISIPPSDPFEMELRLDIACDKRPPVTPEQVSKWALDETYNSDLPYNKLQKARQELVDKYRPKSLGYFYKGSDYMNGYIIIAADIWLASHILLCSGKRCYVSIVAKREHRQRDQSITSFSVSTEPEE